MVKLIAKTPCDGLLPLTIGATSLSEVQPGHMTSIAAFKGQDKALSGALKSAHGMAAPGAGRATGKQDARAIWFGQRVILLIGPAADPSLAQHAALTDQSDAWAVVRLDGAQAADVLARLCPIDLRDDQFRRGQTARTELMHMAASITRVGNQSYQIMVFRAFAQTLVHDLNVAMQSVSARHPV